MIDEPDKRLHRDSNASREEQTGFIRSASDLSSDGPKDPKKSQFYLSIDETSKIIFIHLKPSWFLL